ncbi:MAG: VWA domain-containing protein [Campylobacterota bacterium]
MVFINSIVLYTLFPVALFLLYLLLSNKDKIERVFDDTVLKSISTQPLLNKKMREFFLAVGIILIIIALARPVILKDHQRYEHKKNVLILLDLSQSMRSTDLYPNRLQYAKAQIKRLLQNSEGINYALGAFDRDVYLIAPFSDNYDILRQKIENLQERVNDSTADYLGIFESLEVFFRDKTGVRNIIIFSDFAQEFDKDALNAKIQVHDAAITGFVSATREGAPLLNANAETIRGQWSKAGSLIGVQMQVFDANNDVLEIVQHLHNSSDNNALEYERYNKIELFAPVLWLAVVFVFLSFFSLPKLFNNLRVKGVILLLALSSYPLHAMPQSHVDKAYEAYEKRDYAQAIKEFLQLPPSPQRDYNVANSYYRLMQYEKAIEYYHKIQTQDRNLLYQKYHNLGNTHFQLSQYKKAIEYYEKALEFVDDVATQDNLALAKKKLKQQQKQDKQKQEDQKSASRATEDDTKEDSASKEQQEGTDPGNGSSDDSSDGASKTNDRDDSKDIEQKKAQQSAQEHGEEKGLAQRYKRYERDLQIPRTQLLKIGE